MYMLNLHINIYYNQMVSIYYQKKSRKGLYIYLRWSKVSGQTLGTSECSNSKVIEYLWGFPGGSGDKESACMWETQVQSLGWD